MFAGISSQTFYLSLYFLASISLFFLGEIIIKKKLNYKYFLAIFSYLVTVSPHLYFLFFQDTNSIKYAIFRSFGDPLSGLSEINFLNHLLYPPIFLIKQFLILLPLLILLRILLNNFKTRINLKDKKLIFLFSLTLLPIILMFFTSLIGGVRIRTMWMTTFYVFPGVFVYLFKSQIQKLKFRKFFTFFLIIFLTLPFVYGLDSYIQKDKRTDFPGRKIAKDIQNTWNKNFSNDIEFIIGEGWVYGGWYGGNLSYHLKNRPQLIYKKNNKINNYGLIIVDKLNSKNECSGILLKVEPYFDSCLIGKAK